MKTGIRKILYVAEFILLFFGIPLLLFFDSSIIHPSSVLLPILFALIIYFRKQKDFRLHDLIKLNVSKTMWIKQGILVLAIGIFLILLVLILEPENLFNLPRGNWQIWIALFFFYPIFSAYAQEVVFRMFLFMRYKPLFNKTWLMILASALSFSFAHIVYFSVLSLVLTFLAGIYLALVYHQTRSVLFVSILHGALGFFIFTVGLGQHFWLDMMQWIQ
jgi:uncharacterized protein